nr:ASN_HP1_G0046650.mRNA.1.CDS.1 [Saccharomyces cerevisiae]
MGYAIANYGRFVHRPSTRCSIVSKWAKKLIRGIKVIVDLVINSLVTGFFWRPPKGYDEKVQSNSSQQLEIFLWWICLEMTNNWFCSFCMCLLLANLISIGKMKSARKAIYDSSVGYWLRHNGLMTFVLTVGSIFLRLRAYPMLLSLILSSLPRELNFS